MDKISDGQEGGVSTKEIRSESGKNGLFVILGKIFLGFIIASLILFIGFYIGNTSDLKLMSEVTYVKETKVNNLKTAITSIPTVIVPTLFPETTKTIITPGFKKTGLLSFKIKGSTYTVEVPEKWILTQKKDGYSDVIEIANGDNLINIKFNDATEGVPCGFPDASLKPSEMYQDVSSYTYNDYVEFTGAKGQIYRRVDITANPSAGKNFFTICQKNGINWMRPTSFGFVMYEIPYVDDPEKDALVILQSLDEIFASIKVK
jgi:hypothetical protein